MTLILLTRKFNQKSYSLSQKPHFLEKYYYLSETSHSFGKCHLSKDLSKE